MPPKRHLGSPSSPKGPSTCGIPCCRKWRQGYSWFTVIPVSALIVPSRRILWRPRFLLPLTMPSINDFSSEFDRMTCPKEGPGLAASISWRDSFQRCDRCKLNRQSVPPNHIAVPGSTMPIGVVSARRLFKVQNHCQENRDQPCPAVWETQAM
ncbi:uncharacterized protein LOC143822660 [Paroedura picta]|uniref:uncharacterized protein LOC143822660 n=1 Tax=Paroedura picta TaxID=143630 RepID=UPI0040578BC1